MIRVYIICEGQTEETFVNEILNPHFSKLEIFLYPILIGKRGGTFNFDRLYKDVRNQLLSKLDAYCTTFFDFYGTPQNFPGKTKAQTKHTIEEKYEIICSDLSGKISDELNRQKKSEASRRFIPYVQMYEFEALLFSDVRAFTKAIARQEETTNLEKIRAEFSTPEHINDNYKTAPSKRIQQYIKDYDKPISGSIGALEIGLLTIRKECKLFDSWLTQLENLKPL